MTGIYETLILVVAAVAGTTLIYKLLPFREWNDKKPKFSIFPKYIASFDKPASEIISALEKMQFNKIDDRTYARGKIYGDFSANNIKLMVIIDTQNRHIKVYAPSFGILFDTGDIWQVTADIVRAT